ncbi:methyltransferase domain-containing protein [Haloferax sp. MBLA0076]|uniref:Methyltransferase domain-containing protein n=1 Tax=Haloferax litoreum TaxID=2666140 RepID=A0A6A8GLE8_9EURY|nr:MULTISPECIES: class I SAM-dependent methyltransferase [Haloferax]KAB1194721.1 class I SAM-dependent methyltransferase [Haloferax sp. CBA1148]MRX23302.1 methyltransferase domain-containing protein [Haloferax litoreum]
MTNTERDYQGYTPMDYDADSEADEVYQKCLAYLLTHAPIERDDTVVDIGTGTGIVALELASKCDHVLGRDIYDEWLRYAREKAEQRSIENVSFDHGSFRDPNVEEPVDVVVASYALYMAYDEGGETELRAAIDGLAALNPRWLVVADKIRFGPTQTPTDYETLPSMGTIATLLADAGFTLTDVEIITESAGVLVATR